ncbi:hypothetical protein AKJ39_02640 [candidate division MSBL1 archaeon SCGC-AAA259J03]|uniref:Uncharacterized protein n=1 Tax=candidate division MSBL1 archaeon SCGC-AAA259J03 TaxID=1698269 RepID=A0A656YW77_9EURY|nr:hypothetical protein AKJ39_02640 [candidate division MSBL1 archaeon SCGC-AAA259J03]
MKTSSTNQTFTPTAFSCSVLKQVDLPSLLGKVFRSFQKGEVVLDFLISFLIVFIYAIRRYRNERWGSSSTRSLAFVASLAISRAFFSKTLESLTEALSLTLSAPAFLITLSTAASGNSAIINTPYLTQQSLFLYFFGKAIKILFW